MTHLLLAVAMSWFGWAWLDGIPVALTLSQLPAAVIVLAWVAEHADEISRRAVRITLLACSPASSSERTGQGPVARLRAFHVGLQVAVKGGGR